jgi:purine nucleosidase
MAFTIAGNAMKPIILDTDVGTDVDDAFAIALAASAPELNLKAVTTVYGDVQLRVRMARKLLDLLGREDVPVAAGWGRPLTPDRQSYWGGWEGRGFLESEDDGEPIQDQSAVELITELLRTTPEPLTLVAIGPLTNVAAVLQTAPDLIPNIAEIICMAGTIVPGEEEWNVQCDPDAARIVFESSVPLRLGTRFIVNQPILKPPHQRRLATSEHPAIRALVSMLEVFLAEKQRDITPMYDPVTLSMAYTDAFIQTKTMKIAVHMLDDVVMLEPDPRAKRRMEISTSVNPEQFVEDLVARLLAI